MIFPTLFFSYVKRALSRDYQFFDLLKTESLGKGFQQLMSLALGSTIPKVFCPHVKKKKKMPQKGFLAEAISAKFNKMPRGTVSSCCNPGIFLSRFLIKILNLAGKFLLCLSKTQILIKWMGLVTQVQRNTHLNLQRLQTHSESLQLYGRTSKPQKFHFSVFN